MQKQHLDCTCLLSNWKITHLVDTPLKAQFGESVSIRPLAKKLLSMLVRRTPSLYIACQLFVVKAIVGRKYLICVIYTQNVYI